MRYLIAIAWLFVLSMTSNGQTVPFILKVDLGAIGLVSECYTNEDLQRRVNLTPHQLDRLKSKTDTREWRKLSSKIFRLPESGFGDEFLSVDKSARLYLGDAVTDSQIATMKKIAVEGKYLSQFQPTLNSPFVVRFCDLEKRVDEFRRVLDETYGVNMERIQTVRETTCREIIDSIPLSARPKLAQFVGPKYGLDDEVRNDGDFHEIPYPAASKQLGMIPFLLDEKGLGRLVRLTKEQRFLIEDIEQESQQESEDVNSITDSKRFSVEFDKVNINNKGRAAKLQKLLTNEQKLQVGRFVVQSQMAIKPALPFENGELQRYFNMDDKSWRAFTLAKERHAEELRLQINEISKAMLNDVAAKMGPAVGNRLLYLLGDVW